MYQNNILILTIKSWNKNNFVKYKKDNWYLIDNKDDLTIEKVENINPKYIFVPHWSWIIPKKIWMNFEVIVFHMTDLPYWRWWSPLQNLILKWLTKTKISGIKVNWWIDAWDIYIKENLSLHGTANDILKRSSNIIFEKMIPEIIQKNPIPKKQKWKIVEFKRRKPEESIIPKNIWIDKIYDYIRMLDGEGYPKAFINYWDKKIEFSNARLIDWKLKSEITISNHEK